ncbi:trypsin-1-like [Arctopsyche grandis]|uniref:trypsin-1-like n=1 Tax=Arctopsyche grandis TaxID=121162 RepID=UPI00406D9242
MRTTSILLAAAALAVALLSTCTSALPQAISPTASGPDQKNSFLEWLLNLAGVTTTTTTQAPVLTPPENCPPCSCGQTNTRKRIVGGQETQVNEYPWMTLLLYNGQFYCGGSLINDRYILSAAHCVSGFKEEKMSIRLLEHDRDTDNETETITRKIARVLRHPRYSNQNYNNDIALLRLDEKVELVGKLRPVCMPVSGKSFTGYDGIVTGWGALEEHGAVANALQEVTVPIMSNEECRKTAYGEKRITDNMLCAGFPEGMKDSCQGDSGGPLHIVNSTTNLHHVVGVVSWGEGCAQADHPGVYTRVNRYNTWIRQNTADACYC